MTQPKRGSSKRYVRVGTLSIDAVKQHAAEHNGELLTAFGYAVRTSSLRMVTFLTKGTDCVSCGLKGKFFAIERDWKSAPDTSHHMNLWGVDVHGIERLMTHDHIVARSLGGSDTIDNSQPMCEGCNSAKGLIEGRIRLAQIAQGTHVSKKERAAIKRQDQINKMLTDPTYRATVEFHQTRMGVNRFPEVFGSCKNDLPRVE